MQAKKDPGFHAKWNCWDQYWPGVAPCEGQSGKKIGEIGRDNKLIFSFALEKLPSVAQILT